MNSLNKENKHFILLVTESAIKKMLVDGLNKEAIRDVDLNIDCLIF